MNGPGPGSGAKAPPGHDPRNAHRAEYLALALIVGAAAWLRFYRLGAQALWVDEFATFLVARHPLTDIPSAALAGNAYAPPTYFWVLHLLRQLLGESATVLRLPSAVAGTLTIPVFWQVLRGAGAGRAAALIGAGMLAINPLHLWYSQEARPYAAVLFIGLGSLALVLRAMRTRAWRDWLAYAVVASLAILTHLGGIVFPFVATLWVISRDRRPPTLRSLAAACVAVVLLVSPFLVMLARTTGPEGTGAPPRSITGLEIPYTLYTFIGGYSLGPSVRDIQDAGWRAAVDASLPQTVIGTLAFLLVVVLGVRVSLRKSLPFWTLLVASVAVSLGGAALSGKAYTVRYALPGLFGFLGIAGIGLVSLPPRLQQIGLAALSLPFLWGDLQWFRAPRYWKEDSRAVVACVRASLPSGSKVLVAPDYMAPLVDYYARAAGAELAIVPAPDGATRDVHPAALLLTRLHHVDRWPDLVRLVQGPPDGLRTLQEVGGFRVYARQGGPPSLCGPSAP